MTIGLVAVAPPFWVCENVMEDSEMGVRSSSTRPVTNERQENVYRIRLKLFKLTASKRQEYQLGKKVLTGHSEGFGSTPSFRDGIKSFTSLGRFGSQTENAEEPLL